MLQRRNGQGGGNWGLPQTFVWGKLGVAEAHAWGQDLRKEEGIQRALVGI